MATATVPMRSITRLRGDERARAQEAERHERRGVARLDQREGSKEHGRAREQEDRSCVAPADVGRLDDRVDEQDERTGDGERPGRVVAAPRQRGPALAQEQRATARARPGRGGC